MGRINFPNKENSENPYPGELSFLLRPSDFQVDWHWLDIIDDGALLVSEAGLSTNLRGIAVTGLRGRDVPFTTVQNINDT